MSALDQARALLADLDRGEGALILPDVYGATPCNAVCKLVRPGRVEAIAGVNLPMLLKALTYRDQGMSTLLEKAVEGGQAGILPIHTDKTAHA